MADPLVLRMVPLAEVRRWDRNPKPHDLGAIISSFRRYGFKDPMKFEPALNDGDGGIVEGNGRTEALLAMFTDDPEAPPRGVAINDDGQWEIPVLFGVDADTESEAEAYGLDHNAITVTGGTFGPDWQSRLFDVPALNDVLVSLNRDYQLPVSIDADDLETLLGLNQDQFNQDTGGSTGVGERCTCPTCGDEHRPRKDP